MLYYYYIVACQLIYIIPSLSLYFLEFFYIVLSGDQEFNSAFHRLFIFRAPADFIQVLTSLIAFRFPIAGWQGALSFQILAKLGFMISQYSTLFELCLQFLLSLNRLSAIATPLSHAKLWNPRSTHLLILLSALMCLIPTFSRIHQEAYYFPLHGAVVPSLKNREDQSFNSYVSCAIYISFCVACLICNILAIYVHSKNRKMQLFEAQPNLASKVQKNLLIYSCIFTLVIIAMTIFQCLLALSLSSDARNIVIVLLTLSADLFALSNPWLLLFLSSTFREKFLKTRRLPRIFASSSTGKLIEKFINLF
ncbi:unnamed protein product [Caenorhabditis angaria]|uniref:Serpentine receptor class gamma n=1 Tax=Caenorhabditis angaria TaxID=860376 RepID=A0A9P1MVV6_9PELO|nr:unnamed protein product [Caenorhabditis angaria]